MHRPRLSDEAIDRLKRTAVSIDPSSTESIEAQIHALCDELERLQDAVEADEEPEQFDFYEADVIGSIDSTPGVTGAPRRHSGPSDGSFL